MPNHSLVLFQITDMRLAICHTESVIYHVTINENTCIKLTLLWLLARLVELLRYVTFINAVCHIKYVDCDKHIYVSVMVLYILHSTLKAICSVSPMLVYSTDNEPTNSHYVIFFLIQWLLCAFQNNTLFATNNV